jgi:hypothetical protein
VGRAWLDLGAPEREPVGSGQCLHVSALFAVLAGVPGVDLLA